MSDLVKMTARNTFHNSQIVIDGVVGGTVTDGSPFEADPNLAKDLARQGHADPVEGTLHDIPDAPLEPHYSISETALRVDRERRAAQPAIGEAGEQAEATRRSRGRTGE